ncbi:MAG: alpha/beta hydrolase [Alphaproteobacteria bacterium]|nr:alpha/beta hydrolase [Alphaproteobacteria bacterium]
MNLLKKTFILSLTILFFQNINSCEALKEGFITTSSGKISYLESEGKGETIIFLHSNSISKEAFSKQFDELGQQYHLIAIDLPGHGKSDNAIDPVATYSFPGNAKAVLETLDLLNVKKAILCGWSIGGHIAIEIAYERPKLVTGLFLTGTPPIELAPAGFGAGFLPFEGGNMMGQETNFTEEEARKFVAMSGINPDDNHYFVITGMRTDGNARKNVFTATFMGKGVNQKEFIQETKTPLAFVYGKQDKGINNDYIKSLIYNNLFGIFELDSGHATLWEKSHEFNQLLSEFVDFTKNNQPN